MAEKDVYEKLCGFYEIFAGRIPNRAEFMDALKQTIPSEDLDLFFKIPGSGSIPIAKLAKAAGLSRETLMEQLSRLAREGFILIYESGGERCCERGNPVFMTEQQVRNPEKTWQRDVFARFFDSGIEGRLESPIETKTPYFRVLSAEPAIAADSKLKTLDINVSIPPPGEVLPLDKVTELIRKDARRIGVADCFCRLTKQHLDLGCDHPLETCFVFNDLAHTLIDFGTAREIEMDEAIAIIERCESRGLVHNVDNCTTGIRTLCNCCPCCCIILKSIQRGEGFAGNPSRYTIQYSPGKCRACHHCIDSCPTAARVLENGVLSVHPEKCIGCGLCVTCCPAGANAMIRRNEKIKIPVSHRHLMGKIRREAIFSIIRKKIFRKM